MENSRGNHVNNAIKARRKALKLSQTDVSKRLGMSLRQYQYIESGDGRLYLDLLNDLSTILNMQILIINKECIL